MLCEQCQKKPASMHMTQVIDGKVKKLHLCVDCAKASGLDFQDAVSFTDMLFGMKAMGESAALEEETAEKSCPVCQMTRADFKRLGKLGCAQCYETFADELNGLLKAIHQSDLHSGKVPARMRRAVAGDEERQALQKALESAIAEENFEEAGRIRDLIKSLDGRSAGKEP